MFGSVIKKFEDKLVEVTIARTTYKGRLRFHKHEDVLELVPEGKYASKCFGPVFIDQNAVLAIREVKPIEEKYDDCDDDCDFAFEPDTNDGIKDRRKAAQKQLLSKEEFDRKGLKETCEKVEIENLSKIAIQQDNPDKKEESK